MESFPEDNLAISCSSEFDTEIELLKLGPIRLLCISKSSDSNKEKSYSRGVTIEFGNEEEGKDFHSAFEQWQKIDVTQGIHLSNGDISDSKSKFDEIEPSSAKMYFHYYGQLLHQQNMLQNFKSKQIQVKNLERSQWYC